MIHSSARGEAIVLATGLALFALLARAAAGVSSEPPAPPRVALDAGPVVARASLSQGAVSRDESELFLHVRLEDGVGSRGALPLDLAIAVDVSRRVATSGALAEVARTCLAISDRLAAGDRVAVIAFADEGHTVVSLDGHRVGSIEGGTRSNVAAGLEAAARELRANGRPGSARRVLLVTDGGAPASSVLSTAARLADEGISVSTLGVGPAYDASFLTSLADSGGGRFHHLDDASLAARVFEDELRQLRTLVARSVHVTIVPAPGVELDEVIAWESTREGSSVRVRVGDFEDGRSTKVVARVRVPAGRATNADLVRVSVTADDVRTGLGHATEERRLGVRRTTSEEEILASLDRSLAKDLEDAEVASHLARAMRFTRERNEEGAREAFSFLKRVRPVLSYRGADGALVEKSAEVLESEMLWFATPSTIAGTTGDRYFTTNQTGVIFYTSGAPLDLDTLHLPNNAVIATGK